MPAPGRRTAASTCFPTWPVPRSATASSSSTRPRCCTTGRRYTVIRAWRLCRLPTLAGNAWRYCAARSRSVTSPGCDVDFGVRPTLVPVASIEEGFDLVRQRKADAAVANNYAGDMHATRHGLVETPIAFQPVRLFFASAKGQHGDALAAIDRNLQRWQRDSGFGLLQGPAALATEERAVAYARITCGGSPARSWRCWSPRCWSRSGCAARSSCKTGALRDSERRLSTILDSVDSLIYIKDASYRYQYVNRAVCEFFGIDGRPYHRQERRRNVRRRHRADHPRARQPGHRSTASGWWPRKSDRPRARTTRPSWPPRFPCAARTAACTPCAASPPIFPTARTRRNRPGSPPPCSSRRKGCSSPGPTAWCSMSTAPSARCPASPRANWPGATRCRCRWNRAAPTSGRRCGRSSTSAASGRAKSGPSARTARSTRPG